VVIPNFGGFVANFQSATIDTRINTLQPASKSIVFNKSLSNNDGLLANEIAINEAITFKQAQKVIVEYVEFLKDSLHLHKKIYLDQLGTLLLIEDQKIIFIQSSSRNHLLDSYGYTPIQFSEIVRESVPEKIKTKIKQLPVEKLASNKKSWIKVAAVLLPLAFVSLAGINNQEKIKASYASLNPFNKAEVVIATEDNLDHQFELNSASNDIEDGVSSFFAVDELSTEQIVDISPQHFVIAGSFKSQNNAKKLVAKLNKWNFSDAQVMKQSSNGYYRVCYTQHIDQKQAIVSLKEIKKANPQAWLLSLN
jgi:protein tyrosine/serine phosphatase